MHISEIKNEISNNLPKWLIKDNKLYREIETGFWAKSIAITNMISYLAETFNHHPDLIVTYSKVEIVLFTHDVGSITEKDLQLAQNIEKLIFLTPN